MFSTTTWKQKAGLMALGSIFTIIGMLLSPISAQKDKLGEIECEFLTTKGIEVSASGFPDEMEGTTRISGGSIYLINDSNKNSLFIHTVGEQGGGILIKDGNYTLDELVAIGVDENGGYVKTWNQENQDYHRTGELHLHKGLDAYTK